MDINLAVPDKAPHAESPTRHDSTVIYVLSALLIDLPGLVVIFWRGGGGTSSCKQQMGFWLFNRHWQPL